MEKIMAEHRPWLEKLPKAGDAAELCPACNGNTTVKMSSSARSGLKIRYRVCESCNFRYKTVELLAFGKYVSLRDKTKGRIPAEKEEQHEQGL